MTKIKNPHCCHRALQLDDVYAARVMNQSMLSNRNLIPKLGWNEKFVERNLSQDIHGHTQHLPQIVALPVKDPFHLSRGIILILQRLEWVRMAETESFVVASTYGSRKTE